MSVHKKYPEAIPAGGCLTDRGDIRHRLFSSFSVQAGGILLRIVQQMVLVPALISGWGIGPYQDWIVLSSAAGLITMLDGGLQIYASNAMQIAWSRGDMAGYRRHFSTALWLYAVLTVGAALLLTVAAVSGARPTALNMVKLPEAGALVTVMLLTAASLVLIPTGIFTGIYRVHGDYVHGTLLVMLAEAGRGFGVCAVALLGGTLVGAAWFSLGVAVLLWVAILVDLRRRFGPLPLGGGWPGRRELKTAISQSALYLAPTAATPLVANIPVLVLGRWGTAEGAVVAFTVFRTLAGFVRQFVAQICHPIGAEMAAQQAAGDMDKLGRIFLAGGRLACGISGLLAGLTLALAEPFLRLWTHGAVAYDPWLLLAFLVSLIVLAPAQVALLLFHYNNKPAVLVYAYCGQALATLILCPLLLERFSTAGVAAGTGLAECLSIGALLPRAAGRMIGVSLGRYLARCFPVAIAALGASWGTAAVMQHLVRAGSLAGLLAVGAWWSVVLAIPAILLLLSPAERSWLRSRVSLAAVRLRRS